MPLIYGSGFKPGKLYTDEVKDDKKKSTGDVALFTFLRVLAAVGFIALSFIPIAGEIGEAALISEAAAEAVAEGSTEAAVESAIASNEAANVFADSGLANTARNIRLGDTIKGSIGLGLSEAAVNEGLDRMEGVGSTFNSIINFGLAFLPALGAAKGRRASNIRLTNTIDRQIEQASELLTSVTSIEERSALELRIRQLKNARLVRNKKIFDAPIDSATFSIARKETIRIIEKEALESNSLTVKRISKQLIDATRANELKLSKTEARQIVRRVTRKMPDVSEGITLEGIVNSKTWQRTLSTLQYLDPNLATRKFFTNMARKLSSNEALITVAGKDGMKEYGKWFKNVNLGFYKKFGKKLSEFWRKWGKKIYAHSRVKMIPVVSSWIDGYRLIELPVPGEYIMVVIFKPSKNGRIPPPVLVNPVSLEFAAEFAAGGESGSVGSFYIDRIALARNGSGPALVGSMASILGPLSLGILRKALSGPAALERIIRKVSKGDYFSSILDNVVETSSRLWSHKIGKVLAGRWGIATARGFQKVKHGHTVTSFSNPFDIRHLIDEMGIVTLDKARAVQRKSGITGRTQIIGGKRIENQYNRTIKLMTFGYAKFDGKNGIKKGNGIF